MWLWNEENFSLSFKFILSGKTAQGRIKIEIEIIFGDF
jgi:hypothetical protein